MVALIDVEAALTLFAEGIAGRYYHIKPTSEFASRQFSLDDDQTAMAVDTASGVEDGSGLRRKSVRKT